MWEERRQGDVIVATYADPPMSYYTDAAFGQLDELIDGWARSDARVIVLTGGVEGKFITHFDVDGILKTQQAPDRIFEAPVRSRVAQAVTRRLHDDLPQAVIAAMNGDTMGFGYELSLACDLRILQRGDFRVGLPEVRLGITPAGSGLSRLTRLVGRARALDLILRAKVVPPEEALELGMVTELADDALASALEIAGEIAAMQPLAVAMAKRSIYAGADLPLDQSLALDAEFSFRLKQSPDIQGPMKEYLALPLDRRRDWLDPRPPA
jgi:enoyl-CoA hydratase